MRIRKTANLIGKNDESPELEHGVGEKLGPDSPLDAGCAPERTYAA
jgi:hypothetical protein